MRYGPTTAILLSAVLAGPAISFATAQRDDRDRDDRNEHRAEHRLYDRDHRDYHAWNEQEERLYREYLAEHHMHPRPFEELSVKQQRNYWKWRHEHEREFDRR